MSIIDLNFDWRSGNRASAMLRNALTLLLGFYSISNHYVLEVDCVLSWISCLQYRVQSGPGGPQSHLPHLKTVGMSALQQGKRIGWSFLGLCSYAGNQGWRGGLELIQENTALCCKALLLQSVHHTTLFVTGVYETCIANSLWREDQPEPAM